MKKEKKNKKNVENKSLKEVKNKEKLSKRFINAIKKRWLISGVNTIILIAILIAVFVLINMLMKKINLTAIDCTTSKTFTLTDESKERVKDIDKQINIYFVGYEESSNEYNLAKQYNKANSKINVEIKDVTKDLEFANKYNAKSDQSVIIVESGEISRSLYADDLTTYDSSYNTVDLSEEKMTSAILNVISENTPKVYFLDGYSSITFKNGLSYLENYLKDEVLTYDTLNILSTQKVPDDCDALVIITPEKDFDELTTQAIMDYINKGGNIVWLNGIYAEHVDLTNVNKVLAQYGVNGFDLGYVYETDTANTLLGYQMCFKPEVADTDITSDIYNGLGLVFLNANKININKDALSSLNVEETALISSSDNTHYSTDMTGNTSPSTDEKGSFVLGDKLVKTISSANSDENSENKDEVKSTLVIYGNDYFITDLQINSNINPMIYIYNNKDLLLNTIAHLTNKDEDITIRKDYSDSKTSFTPTDKEKSVILTIIFAVPLLIIFAGIIVKIVRNNKK